MRPLIGSVVVFALSSCGTFGWYRHGAAEGQVTLEEAECEREYARKLTGSVDGVREKITFVHGCMVGKGWVRLYRDGDGNPIVPRGVAPPVRSAEAQARVARQSAAPARAVEQGPRCTETELKELQASNVSASAIQAACFD